MFEKVQRRLRRFDQHVLSADAQRAAVSIIVAALTALNCICP